MDARWLDVTDAVEFSSGSVDGELLPITKCECGKVFRPYEFVISVYRDDPHACPECGRRYVFLNTIRVYQEF